jgi:hypothetical protein
MNTARSALPALAAIAAILAAVAALPVRPAGATAPHVETEHVEFTLTYDCGNGVVLIDEVTEDLRFTTFFDQDGTPVRVTVHVTYFGVVTNPTSGQNVEDLAFFTGIVDLVAGTDTTVGLYYSSTVPGVGVVLHDIGRVVVNASGEVTFVAGPHDVVIDAGGDPTALFCAALGA